MKKVSAADAGVRLVAQSTTADEKMRETVEALRRLRSKIASRQGARRLSDWEIRLGVNEGRR